MGKPVRMIITGKKVGYTLIVPYSHTGGLQTYADGEAVLYRVPKYEVRIAGGAAYHAVRFGLQNRGISPPPSRITCDAGLSAARECRPSWVAGYSPHSFSGASRAGAWRLIPDKGFLVHEGADTTKGQVGGSLGCVEILDGRWNGFLAELELLAACSAPEIGSKGLLVVAIEFAGFPPAELVPKSK